MIRSLSQSCLALVVLTTFCSFFALAQDTSASNEKAAATTPKPADGAAAEGWKPLLPKDGIEGWEVTNFGGEGEVENKKGSLMLSRGEPLTGVTRLGKDFPLENYELRWSAQRVEGSDFFAGITFPVGKEHCSFICGGWGGGLVGISSINGNDASENETSSYRNFKNGEWYRFKIRVDAKNITVWLNDEQILEIERENRKFSVRAEVMRSRPLGYCVFQSKVLIKDWEYRTFQP
ncbi:MAG: DUF1080 domain-containing protein [Planctomycetes bacterium]|nr:DUF1080 domain-containing protein [Planctomycetota bacterium]